MKHLFYFLFSVVLTFTFLGFEIEILAENLSSLKKKGPLKIAQSKKGKESEQLGILKKGISNSTTKSSVPLSQAGPEDITNENFPDLIQSFDYPQTPISEIIKAISKLTNKNFIIDSNIGSKKISIIAPTPITVAEAYKVFLTALSMHELTVVPTQDGKFLKIRRTSDAVRDSVETYYGEYFPRTDQLITYVFSLKYISTDEVLTNIKTLLGGKAKVVPHKATNTLIITDYGSNIEKVKMILKSLDLPGNEERMEVIPLLHADSEEISNLLNKIFSTGGSRTRSYRSGYSSRKSSQKGGVGAQGRKQFSLVLPYSRSNSIIVVGTPSGIESISKFIRKLDIEMDESGGIFVYSIRYGEAKKIAEVLNNVISARSEKNEQGKGKGGLNQRLQRSRFSFNRGGLTESSDTPLFSKNLKIIPDESNNSLIITGDRTDHIGIKTLIAKIDIPRNQVYLRVIILDMDVSKEVDWGVNYYGAPFDNVNLPVGGGTPVPVQPSLGFRSNKMSELVNSFFGSGLVLGFGKKEMEINLGGETFKIKNILGLVNFLKANTNTTILSRPQVMVMDNEKAEISFGEEINVGNSTTLLQGGQSNLQPTYKEAKRQLEFTPFISEETDTVRLVVKQTDDHPVKNAEDDNYRFKRRSLNSTIVVKSGDTAVLGGLMSETEEDTVVKVPLLGDLPIIGWLFKGSEKKRKKSNIFAFITPKIIRSAQESQELRESRMNVLDKDYKILKEKHKKIEKLRNLFEQFEPGEPVHSLSGRPFESSDTQEMNEEENVYEEESEGPIEEGGEPIEGSEELIEEQSE